MKNPIDIRVKVLSSQEHDVYIGHEHELTVNQDTQSLFLHDGVTPGGHSINLTPAFKQRVDLLKNYETAQTKGGFSRAQTLVTPSLVHRIDTPQFCLFKMFEGGISGVNSKIPYLPDSYDEEAFYFNIEQQKKGPFPYTHRGYPSECAFYDHNDVYHYFNSCGITLDQVLSECLPTKEKEAIKKISVGFNVWYRDTTVKTNDPTQPRSSWPWFDKHWCPKSFNWWDVNRFFSGPWNVFILEKDGTFSGHGLNFNRKLTLPDEVKSGVKDVFCGSETYTLALKDDGSVYSWGSPCNWSMSYAGTCSVFVDDPEEVDQLPPYYKEIGEEVHDIMWIKGYRDNVYGCRSDGRLLSLPGGSWKEGVFCENIVDVEISVPSRRRITLNTEGQVHFWGGLSMPDGRYAEVENMFPDHNVVSIKAGYHGCIVLTDTGEVLGWDFRTVKEVRVPDQYRFGVKEIYTDGKMLFGVIKKDGFY